LQNRRGFDISYRFPEIVTAFLSQKKDFVVDGEICVFDSEGKSDFQSLLSRDQQKDGFKIRLLSQQYPATFASFDILELEKADITSYPLTHRQKVLSETIIPNKHIIVSKVYSSPTELWEEAKAKGLEGIMMKRKGSPYSNGERSNNWLKLKHTKEAEIVVTKYEENNKGIRAEADDGIAVQIAGWRSNNVKQAIDRTGKAIIEINFLNRTEEGKYRQPTFKRMVA
ncbi:hypothetical protein ACFL54_09040, partial [Planctomycetota bacterium]